MSIRIVTGYTGTNHITSTDDRSRNAGLFGGELTDVNVLDIGAKFAYSLSGNTFYIDSGEGIAQGVHFRIPYGSTESVTIAAGSQGMNRMDLVGVLYKKNTQTGIESIETKVYKGTATSGTPQPPSYPSGDLYHGDTETFFIMYVVRLSGTAIADVTSFLEPISSLEDMSDDITLAQSDINGLGNRATALETKVGTTNISGSGKSNITALLGNTLISGIAGTVTAAIVALKGLIDAAVNRITSLERDAHGTATYVTNAQFANANGIRYEVRGKVLVITINQTRTSGAAQPSDFVEIATVPYQIDNDGNNNAFYSGCFGGTATPYQLRFRPTSGVTHIDFVAPNTTAGTVRNIYTFALA